jgi:hypothetical protein
MTGSDTAGIRIPGRPQFLLTFHVDDGEGLGTNAFALFQLEPRPARISSRVQGTFRWDPVKHKFITLSKELGLLDAFNQRNY